MNVKISESIEKGKKLVSGQVYSLVSSCLQWSVERRTLMALGKEEDRTYNDYLKAQVNKTVLKRNKDASFRYKVVIEKLLKNFTKERKDVLCVGCRNAFELDAFEGVGFSGVRGIDIQSIDPRILVMDMGKMSFENNVFNIIYSGDALEHAYDIDQALAEFCRVVRPGGYIAIVMPINYSVNKIDRWDVKNVDRLKKMIEKHVDSATVVWEDVTSACMKVIYRVEK
jgi:SAM-dependent methyltransferase